MVPITATNMNYTILIVGGIGMMGVVYWYCYARGVYEGPKLIPVEWEHESPTWQHLPTSATNSADHHHHHHHDMLVNGSEAT